MKQKSLLSFFSLLLSLVLFCCVPAQAFALIQAKPQEEISSYNKENPTSLVPENLYAQSAILIDQNSGKVLFEKNPDTKLYPASITKLMTALCTITYYGQDNLEQTITVTNKIDTVEPSYVPLTKGETIRVIDVLYGLLLRSGNEAAVALAYAVSGGISGFADLMNQKAQELGCENTHFANPHGLTDAEHYTTARDYAKIASAAAENPVIQQIVNSASYTIPATDKVDTPRKIKSKIKLLPEFAEEDTYHYEGCTGMKTGFTNAAQHTFAGTAERNGQKLLLILLGTNTDGKWKDSIKLFDYGFAAYTSLDILSLMRQQTFSMPVKGSASGEGATLLLRLPDDVQPCALSVEKEKADVIASSPSAYFSTSFTKQSAPISKGDVVGTVTFTLDDTTITRDLIATRDMEASLAQGTGAAQPGEPTRIPTLSDIEERAKNSPYKKLLWLLLIPLVLFVVFFVWLLVEINRRKKRRRARRKLAARSTSPNSRRASVQSFEGNDTHHSTASRKVPPSRLTHSAHSSSSSQSSARTRHPSHRA